MKLKTKIVTVFPYILIVALLSFIILKSIHRPIYIWDEAIYANNSLEMAKNNNYFVYTNNDKIEHYNTKPPFVLWLEAISFKIWGYNEAALRIPTYMALLGSLLLMLIYSRRIFENNVYGFVAAFLMLVCPDLIRPHVFLSGELDGVLVFITTWIQLHHLHLIKTKEIYKRDYLLLLILFTLGYFTKSTAILLLIPGLVLSFLLNRQFRSVILSWQFLWCALAFISIVTLYYMIRERYDPGYFAIVWFSEFSRIYQPVMSWHEQPFKYYFYILFLRFCKPILLVVVVSAASYLFNSDKRHFRVFLHAAVLALVYLLVISYPKVKLDYYAAPAYPIICLCLSILLLEFLYQLAKRLRLNEKIIYCCFLVPFFLYRSHEVSKWIDKTMSFIEPQEREEILLYHVNKKYPEISNLAVLMDVEDNKLNHFDAVNFYRKAFFIEKGEKIELHRFVSEVRAGDLLVVSQKDKLDSLASFFTLHPLDSLNNAYLIQTSKKL